MTVREAWQQARRLLTDGDIPDAEIEAEILLRHALSCSRSQLLSRWGEALPGPGGHLFQELIARRLRREPTAYIVGQQPFYGLELYVDARVLIPRPETELIVERAIALAGGRHISIADVGTGCGAIAIALAHHLPLATIYALDASAPALAVARTNLRRHGQEGRVHLLIGDMLQPLPAPVELVVANLPYVSDGEMAQLPPEVRLYEPEMALRGGADGLDPLRRFLAQLPGKLQPGGAFLLEVGQGQGQRAIELIGARLPGAKVSAFPDGAGIERVIQAET